MGAMISSADVFLVSGGARGITAKCVVGMARRFGCRFILLGRTAAGAVPEWAVQGLEDAALKQRIAAEIAGRGERAVPNAIQREFNVIRARQEIAQTLQEIADAGGQAEYLSADVSDTPAIRAALKAITRRLGPVTGIIHGAGTLADKRIEQKSAADFDAVFGPKIAGLASLLACVSPGQLRHLALFSSAAGFFGNAGQTDYAIANEVLNKAAYQLRRVHPACRVVAFDWGPWDGGMVTPQLKALFAQRGIEVIPLDGGVQTLVETLASPHPPVQLVVGSPMTPAPAPLSPELRSEQVRRRLSLSANPFLRDHVIGGKAVLPSTAAVAWMADACEQRHPGYRMTRCAGFQVLKGIVFDETLADHYTLELKDAVRRPETGEIVIETLVSSRAASGRTLYHYRATFELGREVPPVPVLETLDLREVDAFDGAELYEDGTLFHGPSFHGIQRVLRLDQNGITLRCRLPAVSTEDQGQFRVGGFNLFLADVAFQACVVWARRLHGAASLPLSCAHGEQFAPLPFDTTCYVSATVREATEHRMLADLAVHDERGRVALRLSGAECTLSRQLNRLFAPHVMA
jgi:NAD(P)-dependent dehydrogenase (short-subunit alcohol dehydrogenase family)